MSKKLQNMSITSKRVSLNVLFYPQTKDIQFMVIEANIPIKENSDFLTFDLFSFKMT